jgi:hypothetical protein
MTNKMRLIFVIATSLSAAFSVLMSTQFAIDTSDQLLSAVANALGLHEAPTFFCSGGIGNPWSLSVSCLGAKKTLSW